MFHLPPQRPILATRQERLDNEVAQAPDAIRDRAENHHRDLDLHQAVERIVQRRPIRLLLDHVFDTQQPIHRRELVGLIVPNRELGSADLQQVLRRDGKLDGTLPLLGKQGGFIHEGPASRVRDECSDDLFLLLEGCALDGLL